MLLNGGCQGNNQGTLVFIFNVSHVSRQVEMPFGKVGRQEKGHCESSISPDPGM